MKYSRHSYIHINALAYKFITCELEDTFMPTESVNEDIFSLEKIRKKKVRMIPRSSFVSNRTFALFAKMRARLKYGSVNRGANKIFNVRNSAENNIFYRFYSYSNFDVRTDLNYSSTSGCPFFQCSFFESYINITSDVSKFKLTSTCRFKQEVITNYECLLLDKRLIDARKETTRKRADVERLAVE
ncbi:uncharacterized protein LOC122571675 isoform X2 [Bombus pyrosoma]|uniref:uncharacterized protein LOC122571675 isoform X2 n=1 Tax=Bombus pyrosoma TaxID=396416 RepID=UPI001CB89B84|nr:uncharacterized protein LOC122571675 isoform X2 [Bombus pyrosoma]